MPELQPKYSVLELADAVGVPRTTINDWLVRYERYIDFRTQGKRKVYTAATLAVLREISELRNRSLSSFDIEEELAKRHPMRGEVTKPEKTDEQPAPDQSFSPVLRHQMTEMADLLRNSLLDMQHRLASLESEQARVAARARRWTALTVLLAVLLMLVGGVAAVKLQREIEARRDSERQRQQAGLAMTQMEAELGQQLARERLLETDLGQLQQDLTEQEKQFQERLETLRREAATAHEADLLEQRDEFAQSRLELLGQLEAAHQDRAHLDQLLLQLQEQSAEQNRIIRHLSEPVPLAPPTTAAPELPAPTVPQP